MPGAASTCLRDVAPRPVFRLLTVNLTKSRDLVVCNLALRGVGWGDLVGLAAVFF